MQNGDGLAQSCIVAVTKIFDRERNIDVRDHARPFKAVPLRCEYVVFADIQFASIFQSVMNVGQEASTRLTANDSCPSIFLHAGSE